MTRKKHKKFLSTVKAKIKPIKIHIPKPVKTEINLDKEFDDNCTYNGKCPIINKTDCKGCDYET